LAQPIDSGSKAIGSTIHATTGGPDGTRLVVTVMLGGKPYPATLKLSSGEMGLVTLGSNFVQGNYASYDPTGTKIVYIGASGNTVEMINPDADVGYLFVSSATGMSSPRVSPDGSKIAFTKVVAATSISTCTPSPPARSSASPPTRATTVGQPGHPTASLIRTWPDEAGASSAGCKKPLERERPSGCPASSRGGTRTRDPGIMSAG